jgi:hypothetical protein
MTSHRLIRPCAVAWTALAMAAGHGLSIPTARADDPKPARPTIALLVGGADGDLKVLRETLGKIPGLTFKADDLKFADFGRDGGLFTGFLPVEIADLGKVDVGAIAKAVAAADTSKKDRCPPALFVVFRYRPDSVKTDELRAVLARVPGVRAEKSWAGDVNLWVGVEDSGKSRLAEITRALHGAGIKFRDPITDIKD